MTLESFKDVFLITIAKHRVRLDRVHRSCVEHVHVGDVPSSIASLRTCIACVIRTRNWGFVYSPQVLWRDPAGNDMLCSIPNRKPIRT